METSFMNKRNMKKASVNFECIIFMKVGYHGEESFEEIIRRKKQEEKINGKFFWGYSSTLCHPLTQVRPFVMEAFENGLKPVVLFSYTPSKHLFQTKQVKEYSIDKKEWYPLPSGISTKGSKYALVCKNLQELNALINLNMYKVAVGQNKGKPLGEVIRFRVDKACAFFDPDGIDREEKKVKISYFAEITEPFAVFVR
jgi:hypothetical protein